MNGFDLSTVTNIYLGSTPVKKVYMGTKLIWSKTFDYSNEYFTIESLEDSNQIGIVDSDRPSISISTDKRTWTTVTPAAAPTYFITLNAGEKVYIKGSNDTYYIDSRGYFTSTGKFNVSGNIMSLLYDNDFKDKTTLSLSNENAFRNLFYRADKLISAEHLVLQATTLTYYCYGGMFQGCRSLTTAPELPATTLVDSCYYNMFYNCSSLTTAPQLQATTLASHCYDSMFSGCSSLTTAPQLPATTLADYCYSTMFYGCSSLTTAPQLPATTLVDWCYYNMFQGCSSLTTAPQLPATTLASHCYDCMFYDCSSLTTAPELPATTLVNFCYASMFRGCSFTTAPELPATTLVDWCYYNMFYGCSSLNYIKMLAVDVSANYCLTGWVHGVASSGTFVKDASATLPTGENGIPDRWKVETAYDYSSEYLTIESLEDSNQIGIVDSDRPSISISTDKKTWTTVTPNAAPTYFITLNTGQKVYIKGSNNVYTDNIWYSEGYFTSTGRFNVSGNIMSLIYADDFKNKTTLSSSNENAFAYMFNNADKLISAEHLVLPATTLVYFCYYYMFYGCSSLTTAPELPATTLAYGCYGNMFQDCSSLTTAPELPATTLESNCYDCMFYDCSSLTTAPELPATTLADSCYYNMFYGCSSLNYIKMLAVDVSVNYCLTGWVHGVASSGTFVKDASATLPTGGSGIPDGWEVITV